MSDIEIKILACRASQRASGTVTIGGAEDFRIVAEYAPKNTGAGLSYPWTTYLVGRENIPQRFMTFEGALSEVKMLTLRQFDLATQEQARSRINDDLATMVEEIVR